MNWRKKLDYLALSTADAVEIAIKEEIKQYNMEMTEQEIRQIRFDITKLVKQTFKTRFVPKTYMD